MKEIKKDNKGFTLIELIVCILILGIVSGIIVMFVISSTNSYNLVQSEAIMQTEADVALGYINEAAVSATSYKNTETYVNESGKTINAVCIGVPGGYHFLWFEKEEGKLRFIFLPVSDSHLVPTALNGVIKKADDIDIKETLRNKSAYGKTEHFLCQYVTDFSVTLPEVISGDRILKVNIKLQYADKGFETTKLIASRNLK